MPKKTPIVALLDHLGITGYELARQAGVSKSSVGELRRGKPCGGVLWRRISARYALEIRQAGLTVDDFLAGEILTGRPPAAERRRASR